VGTGTHQGGVSSFLLMYSGGATSENYIPVGSHHEKASLALAARS